MGRRSDHSRNELTEMTLAAARELIETEGIRGLTARRLAEKIGYAPGTLYNLFDNLDDLVGHLNADTLGLLLSSVSEVSLEGKPEDALQNLAHRYIAFTQAHPRLWSALFDPSAPRNRALPEIFHERVLALLELVENCLAPFFKPEDAEDRLHAARTLWAALHGYCSLAGSGSLPESESVEKLADTLISNYLAGLRVQAEPFT